LAKQCGFLRHLQWVTQRSFTFLLFDIRPSVL
jgi:hypothetical protein